MATVPPTPTGGPPVPTPPPSPPRRTPVVTAAGGMLITVGVLATLAGVFVVAAGSQALVNGEPLSDTEGVIRLVVGVADIIVGSLILRLFTLGRTAGFVMAAATIVLGLLDLVRGDTRALLQLLLGGLVIWALIAAEPAFRSQPRR